MAQLSPDQRNALYLSEAVRSGIHKPILAALYAVHNQPTLSDRETGLGISPANRIAVHQVDTFPGQVHYAASTIRSLINSLTAKGWSSRDFWDMKQGRYSDRFLQTVADGYIPHASDLAAARLESCTLFELLPAYLSDIENDLGADPLKADLSELEPALLSFVERIAPTYSRLGFQQAALIETVRLWRKLDTQAAAIENLKIPMNEGVIDQDALDQALIRFLRSLPDAYGGYPHQREALLRLVQLWCQQDSRESVIEALQQSDSPLSEVNLTILDPALIAFIQRLPQAYKGQGPQRFALTEAYRMWCELDTRTSALETLGVDPEFLTANADNPEALVNTATQVDKALLSFLRRLPGVYEETDNQRQALIYLVQLWREYDNRIVAIQSLLDDLKQIGQAPRHSPEAPRPPLPYLRPSRPERWTPSNLQLDAAIVDEGSLTWAEATQGGVYLPPNQTTIDAIIRIARLAEAVRDRLGRPLHITRWYHPAHPNLPMHGRRYYRHPLGDAITFYCYGLTGNQIYWALDPWWSGELGRYHQFPKLIYVSAQDYRIRWEK
ncbi:MAG: peptidase M15A [Leptolyngbyaceae cyanobacterium MO_188.B28]|nr:peptidase M15A [Leptolyngbyaceae cyanobacterium MO_188.B28]